MKIAQSSDRPMRRLFTYLKNYQGRLTNATASSVINKVFDLMPPFLTAWLIDSLSGNTPAWIQEQLGLSEPWSIAVFLAGLTIVVFAGESLFEWLFKKGYMRLAQDVQHDLRNDAYRCMQDREIAYFEGQRTGNLMAILNDDINQLERFLNGSFNEIIQLLTLLLVAGWSLLQVDLLLGTIGMLPIPFIIAGSLYYQKRVAPFYRDIREGVGELGARLENNISGIMVIKSFTAEPYEAERVNAVSEAYRNANYQAIRWSSVYVPLIRMLIALGFAGTLLLGAYWVIFEPDRFTVGGLAFFAMMIQRLLWPVTRLGVVFDEFERARAAARRIFTLLDSKNSIQDPLHPRELPPKAADLELENVTFGYQKDQAVLKGISLKVPAGNTVGIAGPTGSGKTTLIKLLLRLYDLQEGVIRIGGIDLRDLRVSDLRRQMALVSQDVYLFHGNLRDNIAYGKPQASQGEIEQAAKRAELHDFIISLPQGYDTIVGERGIKLSGGQRQRLSIARAIVKDAPIIILDEATSAVDTETERAIQHNLRELTKGKTAVIIAHRLSTIRQADQIVVLENGSIAEEGRHEELVKEGAVYAGLWKVQVGI